MNVNELMEDDHYMDDTWRKWEEHFMSMMHQCIPTVSAQLKKNPPWITHDLLRAIRLRNISNRRARKTGKPEHLELKGVKAGVQSKVVPIIASLRRL